MALYAEYGECARCHRWLRKEVLKQVADYSSGHMLPGSFHHIVVCETCIQKADEATEEILRQLKEGV